MFDSGDVNAPTPSVESSAASAYAVPFPEQRYRAALEALRNPKRYSAGLILVLSLSAFVLSRADRSFVALAILIGVLLFHELGHYIGMRAFKYRDVRMFFIPFFGAAVSGKSRGAAAWKEGVVLLLGPIPGIVAALVLALYVGHDATSIGRQIAVSLVSINAINLLPLAGLDGAQLLQHVLFSRHRWLEIGFQLCAALAMAGFAILVESIALGVLSYLMLVVLPHRWRVLAEAGRLREAHLTLPPDAHDLDDDAGRPVFTAAESIMKVHTPKAVGAAMEQLVDAVNARPPGAGASVALGFAWFLGLVLAFATLVIVFPPSGPPSLDGPGSGAAPELDPQGNRPLRLGDKDEFQLR